MATKGAQYVRAEAGSLAGGGASPYLQLLCLEHVGPRRGEHVVRQLGLAVDVDRHGGLAGQEGVVDLPSSVGQLQGDGFGLKTTTGNDPNALRR